MSPRKKRKTRGFSRWFAATFFVGTFLVIVTGAYIYYQDYWHELWWRSRGELYPPERGLSPGEILEEAVILGAREMGVPHHRISRRPGAGGMPLYEFRCPDRLHPITANRWFTRILADGGVEILDCVEEGKAQRPKLRYHLLAGEGEDAVRAQLLLYPPTGEPPLRETWPRLALVIDDFGYSYSRVPRGLLDLGVPITASILPELRHSRRIEKEARRRGHGVFLHLPMEPRGYPEEDPGPGTVFVGMSADSITALLDELARDFERLDGLNNHMGSRATCVDSVVLPILAWARNRELLVVDSYTDPKSRIYPLARHFGMPALRADFFLDGEREDEGQIMENIAVAAETARKRGWAMVIGHPRPETLRALRKMAPRLKDYGLRFVTVPELARSLGEDDPAPPATRGRGRH